MDQSLQKYTTDQSFDFFNIFPQPKLKEQLCTKEGSFHNHQTSKSSHLLKKKNSSKRKNRKLKKSSYEDSDSPYEPSERFSDPQMADEKPLKKLKMENVKIQKNQKQKSKKHKYKLRVRDVTTISREQFQKSINSQLKIQHKVKIMVFDVDESQEIYM